MEGPKSLLSRYMKLDVTLIPSSKWPPSSSDSIDKVSRSNDPLGPDLSELLDIEVIDRRFALFSSTGSPEGSET